MKEFKIYSTKENPLPVGRYVLVYADNVEEPGWYIDKFKRLGKSDNCRLDGFFYEHDISHWAELPDKPESED